MDEAKKKTSIIEKIKADKKIQYLLIAAVLILAIVIAISCFSGGKKEEAVPSGADAYVTGLEKRLSDTLSRVNGVGKVSVVITVESGMETVLAMKSTTTETSSGKEIVETPVIVNGKTVVLKELYPKVTGVLIVAEGAENLMVMQRIQQATTSLLDININQIEILTMK